MRLSGVTENRYGRVYFDGVCSDTSNAAYPVDEVREAVEDDFEPPWTDAAVHLGLTLLHRGYVVYEGDAFALSEKARDASRDGRLVADICEDVRPRVEEGRESDAAAFVGFVRGVVNCLTEEV